MRYVPEIEPAPVKVEFGSLNRGDFYVAKLGGNHAIKLSWGDELTETVAGSKFNAYSLTYNSFINVDSELEVYKATASGEVIKQFTTTPVDDLVVGDVFSSPKIGIELQLHNTVYQVVAVAWDNSTKYCLNLSTLVVHEADDFRQVVKLEQVE